MQHHLYCLDCKQIIFTATNQQQALDERDYHGIARLHNVDVLVDLEPGRRIRLAGICENGRSYDLV